MRAYWNSTPIVKQRDSKTSDQLPVTVSQVIQLASEGDATAERALKLFATTYGAYVGNLALLYQPMGGIYIGGSCCNRTSTVDAIRALHQCLP